MEGNGIGLKTGRDVIDIGRKKFFIYVNGMLKQEYGFPSGERFSGISVWMHII